MAQEVVFNQRAVKACDSVKMLVLSQKSSFQTKKKTFILSLLCVGKR